jgi:methionyl-tRNA formyltransferase
MRIIFAGTPAFAAQALKAILAAGHEVVLVLTQPDRPAGRGMKLQPSAVKAVALAHQIPVFQPERLKDPASHETIRQAAADVMVVAAYGLILPQAVLDLPRHGGINIHASLLPRWRGAAPIHRAIEAGDTQTGITLMQMDAGLDTGPMLLSEVISIKDDETSGQLHDRLAALGAKLIVKALGQLDQLKPQSQAETGISYANKIDKQEAHLDWSQPAPVLERKIRAFNPFPGATVLLAGKPVKIWQARISSGDRPADTIPGAVIAASREGIQVACGKGVLLLTELQSPGSRRMSCSDFLHGAPLKP